MSDQPIRFLVHDDGGYSATFVYRPSQFEPLVIEAIPPYNIDGIFRDIDHSWLVNFKLPIS